MLKDSDTTAAVAFSSDVSDIYLAGYAGFYNCPCDIMFFEILPYIPTDAKISEISRELLAVTNGNIYENSGTDTLLNGNTSVIVAHGLSAAPTVINITWRENPDNVIADWWVDTIGVDNFTLNGVDPGASNLDFGWEAKVG